MSVREIGNISSYKKGILHWQNKAASLERAHDELEEEVIECEAQLDDAKQRVAKLEARNHKLMIACNFAIGSISVVLATMHNVTPTKRTLTKTINKLENALNKDQEV